MAMVAISVKCLALFVLIAFSLAAVSGKACTSDADCNQFLSKFCCQNECVDKTSGCCSKDLDCFDGESCCNHKCKLDCDASGDDGDNGNTVVIVLGVIAGIIFIIFVALYFHYYRERRLRYILIIEENGEITVPSSSNNTTQPPTYQQGYSPAPPPYTPSSTRASEETSVGPSCRQPSYGTVQRAGPP